MFLSGLITALIVALIFAVGFSLFIGNRGPWGGFLWFFLVVFLGAWAVGVWSTPVGPHWMGVAWLPFFIGALAFALLLAALSEPGRRRIPVPPGTEAEAEAEVAVGFFFWLLMLLLIAVILAGAF